MVVRFSGAVGGVPGDHSVVLASMVGARQEPGQGVNVPRFLVQSHPHCCVHAVQLGPLWVSELMVLHLRSLS